VPDIKPHRLIIFAGIACLTTICCALADDSTGIRPLLPIGLAAGSATKNTLFVASLPIESQAARFARDEAETSLYTIGPPRWSEEQPEWLEPQKMLSAGAFEEVPHQALLGPPPQPSSLWERWRQQRLEHRRRPASWFRYRFYFEKFTSLIRTDEPVHDQIHDGRGNLFGGRLGWDFAPRWGVETRLGYLRSTMTGANSLLPPHENFLFWDTSALFYLRGDERWRPFLLCGLGMVDVGFIDNQGVRWNQILLTMPFGAGFKYRISDHNALRFEVLDNLVFGNGHGGNSRAMSDMAVGFAFERRFGKPHKTYFPKNDGSRWTRYREWLESMVH
jgi:hypothetical protein